MTLFEAVLTKIADRRAVALRFRINERDHKPRRVLLIETVRLDDNTGLLPFVWHFENERPLPRGHGGALWGEYAPVLTVVAGPGVSIMFDGWPDKYLFGPGNPQIKIYRVQDPSVLPRLATDIKSEHLVGTYEISPNPDEYWFLGERPVGEMPQTPPIWHKRTIPPDRIKRFTIKQLPNGVAIRHPTSGDQWTITVPESAGDPPNSFDQLARYAFEIDVEASMSDINSPMLKIVTTPFASVTLMNGYRSSLQNRLLFKPDYWALWKVQLIGDIPPQGTPIEPRDWWTRDFPRQISSPQDLALRQRQALIDVAIGFIPVVGDLVDIAELVYGVITGEDKWGNPLSRGELAILGASALLPFVAAPTIRATRRLVQRFADHAEEAEDLTRRLKQANISAEDIGVIRRIETMIKAGQQIPPDLWDQVLEILRRIPGPQPTIALLLNAKSNGFAHFELEAAYKNYKAKQLRQNKKIEDVTEWARRQTTGRPSEILVKLLGPDFRKRVVDVGARRMKNLDVPMPDKYLDKRKLEADLNTVWPNPRLWERLSKFLTEPRDPGAASLGVWIRQISIGRFHILKGNVGEIFSMPIQHNVLVRIAKEKKENSTAVLASGVRVRLAKEGESNEFDPSVMFSDNIIIVQKGNSIEIKAVFEVKSGFKGGEEAAKQIFNWVEARMTDGSQLILPKGTTLTNAQGGVRTLEKDYIYTWKPSEAGVATVTGLGMSAERHLIIPTGSSSLGIDSELGVYTELTTHRLDQTSAELDYICAYILRHGPSPQLSMLTEH